MVDGFIRRDIMFCCIRRCVPALRASNIRQSRNRRRPAGNGSPWTQDSLQDRHQPPGQQNLRGDSQ